MAKRKRTNVENTTQKTKDSATQIPQNKLKAK